jgi:hypothetical protein
MRPAVRPVRTREDRFAELVSDGYAVHEAGKLMNLTVGQTSRVWRNIKTALGLIDYR